MQFIAKLGSIVGSCSWYATWCLGSPGIHSLRAVNGTCCSISGEVIMMTMLLLMRKRGCFIKEWKKAWALSSINQNSHTPFCCTLCLTNAEKQGKGSKDSTQLWMYGTELSWMPGCNWWKIQCVSHFCSFQHKALRLEILADKVCMNPRKTCSVLKIWTSEWYMFSASRWFYPSVTPSVINVFWLYQENGRIALVGAMDEVKLWMK